MELTKPLVARYKFTPKQEERLLQWADWLDETDLPQGGGALKKRDSVIGDDTYCCMGVYVQMRDPSYFTEDQKLDGEYICPMTKGSPKIAPSNVYYITQNSDYLPSALGKELGIYHGSWGEPDHNELQRAFAFMNDELEYNFNAIAREIRHLVEHGNFTEETLEGLKVHGGLFI